MSTTHPEPAEIAAFDADLLTPDEAAILRDHLADCDDCAAVLADLQTLSSELHAIPSPPIPDDVAARIDAALMAEAAAATVSRETRTVRRARWPRMALAAAAALVAVGLGGTLLQTLDLSIDSVNDSDEGGGEAADAAMGRSADDPLEAEVRLLLADDEAEDFSEHSTEESDNASPTGPDTTSSGPTVPSCVWEIVDRPEEPVAVGKETFDGRDAYVVVFPDPSDSGRVDAYAVAADCDFAPASADAEMILDRGNYPREP